MGLGGAVIHPVFGERSLALLATCDERLQRIAQAAIRVGMDFSVISGHRGKDEQEDLFARGLSRKRWPDSRHNSLPSLAFDVAPWPIDWSDRGRFLHLAGILRTVAFDLAVPIRWGGDWDGDFDLKDQTFFDLGHFELIGVETEESRT